MKLTKKEVEKVCKDYNIGKLKSFKLIEEGLVNHNFDVKTGNGSFILRVLKKGKGPRQKDNEFKALHFLIKNKYSYEVPAPILNKENKEISKIRDKNIWVYKKLQGKHLQKFNNKHLKQIARALVEYHFIIKKLGKVGVPPKWWLKSDWIFKKFNKMKKIKSKNKIDKLMLENVNYVESIMKRSRVVEFTKNSLLCHCDFNANNLLWKENKLEAVLDFDNCTYRPRIFDVSYTISQFCNKKQGIDERKMKVFLDEYQKKIKLTKEEIKLIFPLILRHQAIIFEWIYNGMKKATHKRYDYLKWGISLMKTVDKQMRDNMEKKK